MWKWRHEHGIPTPDGTITTLGASGQTPSHEFEDLCDRVETWVQIASTLAIRAEYIAIDPMELVREVSACRSCSPNFSATDALRVRIG